MISSADIQGAVEMLGKGRDGGMLKACHVGLLFHLSPRDGVEDGPVTADLLIRRIQWFQIGAGSPWAGKTLYKLYGEAYTPWDWHPRLFGVAREAVGVGEVFREPRAVELGGRPPIARGQVGTRAGGGGQQQA